MIGTCYFEILRKQTSYRFKADMSAPDSWEGDHNAKHNMEDTAILWNGNDKILEFKVQTVANMPGARHTDTVVPGQFFIKWDQPRRKFKGKVHGIVGAFDQDGQMIDEDSVETIIGKNGAPADWARWIAFHSTDKNDPETGKTRFAWSAGCFIVTAIVQALIYMMGTAQGFQSGDHIPCVLREVD